MATSVVGDEAQRILMRSSDVDKESLESLMPVGGYEEMPIVSLERAVEPLVTFLPTIQNYANIAKERCKNPPFDGLTIDESASIILYSMSWKPLDKCLYVALNAVLQLKERNQLEPWFLYLKLFLTALSRLPSRRRYVYRGVTLDLPDDYPIGKTVVWWEFTSCNVSLDDLQSELFSDTTGTRIIFYIDCESGKDIQKHSYYLSGDEILLLPGTQFKVTGCLDQDNGLYTIQLKETQSSVLSISSKSNQPATSNI